MNEVIKAFLEALLKNAAPAFDKLAFEAEPAQYLVEQRKNAP
jgi:hypothetical protein